MANYQEPSAAQLLGYQDPYSNQGYNQIRGYNDPAVFSSYMSQNSKEAILSALKEITNEEATIKDVRFILSGIKEVTMNNQIHKIQMHDALLNQHGVNQIAAYLYGWLAKNITLSCLTQQYIDIKTRQFYTNISIELGANWIHYGIQSKSNHAQIRGLLTQHIYSQMTRALNGLTIIKTLENTNVNENRNMDGNSQGLKGFLGLGGLFGGRRQ